MFFMNEFFYIFLAGLIIFFLVWFRKNKAARHNNRILVIDDDKTFGMIVTANLKREGYEVLWVPTGEQGLEMAGKNPPDLIILDVMLPGITGREVCSRLKEDSQTKDIPIIFMTVKDSPSDIKAELEAGAIDHLTKPVDYGELSSEIKKILGN